MRVTIALALASGLLVAGCSRGEATAKKAPEVKDPYAGWPESTMRKPDMAGGVDHDALRVPNDAEPTRVPSTFTLPDWAEQTSPLAYMSPKKSKIEIHYLERSDELRQQDDAKIKRLIEAKSKERVVAPPWKGWWGEAGTAHADGNKSIPYRERVFCLFQDKRYLELHVEWPTGSKVAQSEADQMVRYVIHSIGDYKKAPADAKE